MNSYGDETGIVGVMAFVVPLLAVCALMGIFAWIVLWDEKRQKNKEKK